MTRTKLAPLLVVATLGAAWPASPVCAAPPPTEAELSAARERFREGLALEEAGDWAGARAKFEQVAATKTSPQVLFHLALCDENLGALVAAARGYEAALAAAAEAGPSAEAVAETTRERQGALAARIPTIRVELSGARPEDEVALDGRPVPRREAEGGVAVDPGEHGLTLVRGGRTIAERRIRVGEGERAMVRLEAAEAPTPPPPPPPRQPTEERSGEGTKVPALVVGGIGLAAVVGAGVTFGLSRAAVDEVLLTCRDPDAATGCDPAARGSEDEARSLTTASIVLAGVGAACLVTGAILWVTLGDDEDAAARPRGPAPRRIGIAPSPLGAVAFGQF